MIRAEGEWLHVDDRRWWGEFHTDGSIDDERAQQLSETLGWQFAYQRRQFIVRFESGWSVSVIWGSLTYSSNHEHGMPRRSAEFVEQPELVEAAIFHKDRDGFVGDDVHAYLDGERLNVLLTLVSQLSTDAELSSPG